MKRITASPTITPTLMVLPKRRGSRSSVASVSVCGTVVVGSSKGSLMSTFAALMPRKLIISVVTISFTP